MWRGSVTLPLDQPVAFKYIQVNAGGGLVAWGQDIAGGNNITLEVTKSDDDTGGLSLTLEPQAVSGERHITPPNPLLTCGCMSAAVEVTALFVVLCVLCQCCCSLCWGGQRLVSGKA